MFQLVEEATYWWPIKVRAPAADDPGNFEEFDFDVKFLYLDTDQHKALTVEAAENKLEDPQMVERIVVGFRKVVLPSGADLVFSEDNLRRLAKVHGVAFAIVREYWTSRKEAQEKN